MNRLQSTMLPLEVMNYRDLIVKSKIALKTLTRYDFHRRVCDYIDCNSMHNSF